MKPDGEAIAAVSFAVDRALRELAPAALEHAGLAQHAARLRGLRPASASNGAYAGDVVHHAFVAARKLMHEATASNDMPAARALGYAGAIAHAAADACAALGASKLGGPHFLHGAKVNAADAERLYREADLSSACSAP